MRTNTTPNITRPLTPSERRRICGLADVDDRTVKRWLAGRPIRSGSAERIERAYAQLHTAAADKAA